MQLKKVPGEKELLEIALRRARKEAAKVKPGMGAKQQKAVEIRRIEVAGNYVSKVLENAVKGFPSIGEMPQFYQMLLPEIIAVGETKRALAQMGAVAKIVKRLKTRHIVELKKIGRRSGVNPKEISRRFLGRLASAVKTLGKSIGVYNKSVEKMRELPDIKELPTAIIAGYPNVGKSTLLGKLTGSKPKVASYPFTTQRLELGYFTEKYREIQVIDTPGLLDRPLEKRNSIEKKGIAALKHLASLIVFVVDPTESCACSLETQLALLESIGKEFEKENAIVYFSKADIATGGQIENAGACFKGFAAFSDAGELKSKIASMLAG